jgi:hypothetical protein
MGTVMIIRSPVRTVRMCYDNRQTCNLVPPEFGMVPETGMQARTFPGAKATFVVLTMPRGQKVPEAFTAIGPSAFHQVRIHFLELGQKVRTTSRALCMRN